MSIFKTVLPGTGMAVSGRHGMRQSRKEMMPISRSQYGPVCPVFAFHGAFTTKQNRLRWTFQWERCVGWRDRSERENCGMNDFSFSFLAADGDAPDSEI
jgi:hypothetical protein